MLPDAALPSMEHALAEQGKANPAIHRPFDELELRYVTFDHTIIDPPGEASPHCVFVFLYSGGKGLKLRKVAPVYLR